MTFCKKSHVSDFLTVNCYVQFVLLVHQVKIGIARFGSLLSESQIHCMISAFLMPTR